MSKPCSGARGAGSASASARARARLPGRRVEAGKALEGEGALQARRPAHGHPRALDEERARAAHRVHQRLRAVVARQQQDARGERLAQGRPAHLLPVAAPVERLSAGVHAHRARVAVQPHQQGEALGALLVQRPRAPHGGQPPGPRRRGGHRVRHLEARAVQGHGEPRRRLPVPHAGPGAARARPFASAPTSGARKRPRRSSTRLAVRRRRLASWCSPGGPSSSTPPSTRRGESPGPRPPPPARAPAPAGLETKTCSLWWTFVTWAAIVRARRPAAILIVQARLTGALREEAHERRRDHRHPRRAPRVRSHRHRGAPGDARHRHPLPGLRRRAPRVQGRPVHQHRPAPVPRARARSPRTCRSRRAARSRRARTRWPPRPTSPRWPSP